MKKVFSNTSEVVHVFAQQTQSEGRNQSGSIYFKDNRIYSYGSHYLLGEFIHYKTIIINDFGYSVTTSKHICELINATSQYEQFFTSSIDIKHVETEIDYNLKKLSKANKPEIYISNITKLESSLTKWVDYCKENKIKKEHFSKYNFVVNKSNYKYKKIVKTANSLLTPEALEKIKEKGKKNSIKQKAKDKKDLKTKLDKFNAYKIDRFKVGEFDYLRLSENKQFVETSQNIRIEKNEAKKLYFAIKKKVDIRGQRIGYFTINKIDNKALTVGCHKICIKSVKKVGQLLISK
tara:strand:+ start:962 stop:1837 length:876 start_codon:yes stop_codon:yes gene_type:complete